MATLSNEGRCSQCHISYNWKDDSFDFSDTSNIDCLVCHDTTGTYKKHPSADGGGGQPAMMIDGSVTRARATAITSSTAICRLI